MSDRDLERPAGQSSGGIEFEEMVANFGILPAVIGDADLERLNRALAEMFDALTQAARLRHTSNYRAAAIMALRAAWTFIARFEVGLGQNLHASLIELSSALIALNDNNVEPLLQPTPAMAGGRAPDSPARQALIGFAAGAVGRLRWTGLHRAEAHKLVADALRKVGVRPSRGSGRVTERTVREWCERATADYGGRSTAAMNAASMLTKEWEAKIKVLPPPDARKFVLDALIRNVLELMPTQSQQKPTKPPS
jgi:hypothetical protein